MRANIPVDKQSSFSIRMFQAFFGHLDSISLPLLASVETAVKTSEDSVS